MQSWNAVFFLFFLLAIRCGAGGISGRVRVLNLTVPLGSGRVGSDNLGYGPGSGFSFEPVQTSSERQGQYIKTVQFNHRLILIHTHHSHTETGDHIQKQVNSNTVIVFIAPNRLCDYETLLHQNVRQHAVFPIAHVSSDYPSACRCLHACRRLPSPDVGDMLVSRVCLQEKRKQSFLTLAKENQSTLGNRNPPTFFFTNPNFVLLIRDRHFVSLS